MSTRKFSRVPFRIDATIKAADRQFQGEVENLSMSGMSLVTDEKLSLGETVDITITLTGTSPEICVNFDGSVSRTTDQGLAFSFNKIDLDSYMHLKNIVSYNIDDAEKVMEEICHSIDAKIASEK